MTKEEKLKEIAQQVAQCQKCSLYQGTNKAVPGDGSSEAKVMFIGEGPGYWEDQTGLPFVGAAGKLLDKLLQSIELERKEVFIGNVIKHRPSENRDPLPDEIEACRPFLDEQIRTIKPKIIVTLGRYSMNKFLPGEKISQIHGQARYVDFSEKRYIVISMYHPAAALRSGRIMDEIKKDFLKIKLFLEDQPNKKAATKTEEVDQQMKLI